MKMILHIHRKSCKNGFLPNWRWLFLVVYLITAFWIWKHWNYFISLYPVNDTIPFYPLYKAVTNLLFWLLGVIGLIGTITLIKRPMFSNCRMKKWFKEIGFTNHLGKCPILISKRRDKTEDHGTIWTFKDVGISMQRWDNAAPDLEIALKSKIRSFEYGKHARKVLIYAIPTKYVHPKWISTHDDYLIDNFINLLCVGATGTGKSYAMLTLAALLAKIPNVSISICDYKKSSFAQFDTPNFYGYQDVPNGIRVFYKEFSERLKANDAERNKQIRVLIIDEYGALISSQEKKVAEELKTMVADMLFMGRSLGIKIIIGTQRADSEHFKSGARDQFRAVLALGNLSKEQKQMLFSDCKDGMTTTNGIGEGYLLVDGHKLERVKIGEISDFEALNESIRKTMYR